MLTLVLDATRTLMIESGKECLKCQFSDGDSQGFPSLVIGSMKFKHMVSEGDPTISIYGSLSRSVLSLR